MCMLSGKCWMVLPRIPVRCALFLRGSLKSSTVDGTVVLSPICGQLYPMNLIS